MEWHLLVTALASGTAVAVVTHVSGRLGGTLGGLLATAPVTSTAAILYLQATDPTVGQVLHGAKSLFSALVAIPVFVLALHATRSRPTSLRIALASLAFLAVFAVGNVATAAATPPGWEAAWVLASLGLAALLGATFLPAAGPPTPAPPATLRETALRFGAGASVILLVDAMRQVAPSLGAAWAFFPGTFLVTLVVLGIERGPAFAAQVARGGVLGVPPLLGYLLTVWALDGLVAHAAWPWFAQIPAWIVYFAAVWLSVPARGPAVAAPGPAHAK